MRKAIVIEEFLPLADHAQVTVVHDDDLDGQAIGDDGRQFGQRHLETAVARNGEDQLIGVGDLRTHGGGHAEAHGTEAAGVNPEARLIEAN